MFSVVTNTLITLEFLLSKYLNDNEAVKLFIKCKFYRKKKKNQSKYSTKTFNCFNIDALQCLIITFYLNKMDYFIRLPIGFYFS